MTLRVDPKLSTTYSEQSRTLYRSGEGRDRTGDTTIFSRVLYQLSYLAKP